MQKPNITFNNKFRKNLAIDPIKETDPRQVEHAAYSNAQPVKVKQPKTVIVAVEVAEMFDFDKTFVESDQFAHVFTGNQLLDGMEPYAMCYGGFQFGHWAGQLGDGRAINLGEVETKRNALLTLQLKGSGPTPYSRKADGLAVLRSSVREFLCSEAMYHLGIPTTRALSLCLTGEHVVRDMMYDGNAKAELGAVVCRVSKSFMRFGSFQLPAMRRDLELLTQMVNYSITQDFPALLNKDGTIDKAVYLAWFDQVCDTTSDLITHWMRVGFVHGVMNTDNLSIIGETIDFGPYGWIDNFDLTWTPNTTDSKNRRYRFGAQGEVSLWNLCQLANSIIPLIGGSEELQAKLDTYGGMYEFKWHQMMIAKLGLSSIATLETINQNEIILFKNLEALLSDIETDMTIFYRLLASLNLKPSLTSELTKNELTSNELVNHFSSCYYELEQVTESYSEKLLTWIIQYKERFEAESYNDLVRASIMNKVNPKYVLRNYLSQQAIEKAENGDFSEIKLLHQLLKNPYDEQPEFEEYASKRPEWAKTKVGCSMLSCSS